MMPAAGGRMGASADKRSVVAKLLPLTLIVFIAFLSIGLPLPVLPLHVQNTLGMGSFAVGVVAGCQFLAALLTRAYAGNSADTRGAKGAAMLGLLVAGLAGLVYGLSCMLLAYPAASLSVLILGRALLGCAESLIATGMLAWGVGIVGPQNAGKVMAWVGIAIYGAYAIGAPAGIMLYQHYGFAGIAAATALIPVAAWLLARGLPATPPPTGKRIAFYKVLGAVWLPGLGLAFSSAGFGVITAFISLLFAAKHWGNASLAFTAFGVAFIAARLLFGHLPDRIGGARVALVSVLIEAAGQALIWLAATPAAVYVGVALTGFGYSLAFPGFGVEAVRRAPPQSRAAAMGAYVAFLDIALAVTNPLSGLIGGRWGIGSIYLAAAAFVSVCCRYCAEFAPAEKSGLILPFIDT